MDDAKQSPPPSITRRKLSTWGCLGLLSVGALAFGVSLAAATWIVHERAKSRLAAKLDALRANGSPVDSASLVRFLRVPQDVDDLSSRYAAVFRDYPDNFFPQDGSASLPIVGGGRHDPPTNDEPWPDLELAEAYLAKRPLLPELERLGSIEGAVALPLEAVDSFPSITVAPRMSIYRDLDLRFHVQIRRRDRAAAARTTIALAGVARAMANDPLVDAQYVRLAFDRKAMRQAETLLGDADVTQEEIRLLRRAFQPGYQASLVRALQGERAAELIRLRAISVDQLRSWGGSNGGWQGLPIVGRSTPADVASGDLCDLLDIVDELIEAAQSPAFHDALERIAVVEKKARAQPRWRDKTAIVISSAQLAHRMLARPFGFARTMARGEAQHRALHAILDWEEQLAGMSSSERTTAAAETFLRERLALERYADPFTGQPLRFRVTTTETIIYSVGEDNRDDGGHVSSVDKRPTDFGVRIERSLIDSTKPSTNGAGHE